MTQKCRTRRQASAAFPTPNPKVGLEDDTEIDEEKKARFSPWVRCTNLTSDNITSQGFIGKKTRENSKERKDFGNSESVRS